MMLSSTAYDMMMSKLLSFEKGFEKLQKLDKLDSIEICVKTMSVKVQDFEQRLNTNEKTTSELKDSVSFMSDQFDKVAVSCAQNLSNIAKCDSDLKTLKHENDELRSALSSLNALNKSLKDDLLDFHC